MLVPSLPSGDLRYTTKSLAARASFLIVSGAGAAETPGPPGAVSSGATGGRIFSGTLHAARPASRRRLSSASQFTPAGDVSAAHIVNVPPAPPAPPPSPA